jgi:nucleoside-diphosphate-sugar epimerase
MILVTGAAGFIGSHLAARLVTEGYDVRGVDCFTPYYDVDAKRANVASLAGKARFKLVEADLRFDDLDRLLEGVDVVFHQAAQPGVRLSWSHGFAAYTEHNVLATQRLLEAARQTSELRRFVHASSSSVYGNAERYPCAEDALPAPFSPYGVTKLAAEHLCAAYAHNHGVPTVSLRYFTVYGPGQRPDMAFHRMIEAALGGDRFPLYGDGSATRDFTYVDDVVEANVLAATPAIEIAPGSVFNVAGGSQASVADVLERIRRIVGRPVPVDRRDAQPGDVDHTGGATDRVRAALGWEPSVDLDDGLARQVEWHRARRR